MPRHKTWSNSCAEQLLWGMPFSASPDPQRETFIVHARAHVVVALEASRRHNVPVVLVSAPGAVRTGGAGWWREIIAQGRAAVPGTDSLSILDCADESGMALAAIREGVEAIALKAPAPTLERVKDIAEQSEVAILDIAWAGALDLGASNDPQADSENHLAKGIGAVANPRALG